MRFSIIVPVFNAEKYLNRCIYSVLNQEFRDFELILVDDGSSDDSGIICDNFSKKNKNIIVIHQDNKGSNHARKTGANFAKGEYIICLDSDDYLELNYLSKINEDITKHMETEIFIYNLKYVSNNSVVLGKPCLDDGIYYDNNLDLLREKIIYDETKDWPNFGSIIYSLCCKIIKKDLFVSSQNQVVDDISIGEDMICTIYLMNNCTSLFSSSFAGYNYCYNPKSLTKTFNIENTKKIQKAVICLIELNIFKNKICAFALSALLNQISVCCKEQTYKYFKSYIKFLKHKCKLLWDYSRLSIIKKAKFKQKCLIYLFKNNCYFILYLYYHYFSK